MAACAGEASSNEAEAARETSDPRSTRRERSGACWCSCGRWAATLVDDARIRAVVADDDLVCSIASDTRSGRRKRSRKKKLPEKGLLTRHVVHGRAIPPARAACACVGRRAPAPARCVCLAAADRNSFSSPARSQHREGGRQHRDARPHDRRRSPMLRHGHGSRVHRPGIRRAARRHPRPVKLEHVLVNLEHVLVVLDDAVAAR